RVTDPARRKLLGDKLVGCYLSHARNLGEKSSVAAVPLYEKALAVQRGLKDRAGEAQTLGSIATAYWTSRQDDKAVGWYEKALSLHCELKDRASEATTIYWLGYVHQRLNQSDAAIRCYEQ